MNGPDKDSTVIHDLENGLIFEMNGVKMRTDVLKGNILLRPGQLYSQKKIQNTYSRLVDLDLFESLNIQTKIHEDDSAQLDVTILLYPASKFDLTWQPQLITTEQRFNQSQSSRNYGLANEISLTNKNAFGSGEEFSYQPQNSTGNTVYKRFQFHLHNLYTRGEYRAELSSTGLPS